MRLNKCLKVSLICLGILSLAACSARKPSSYDVSDANSAMSSGMGAGGGSGASASGIGGGSSWGDASMMGQGSKNKRVYYFDYDRSDVRSSDYPSIYANANFLLTHPHARTTIEGHTDPRGSREYNVALGERRANAVAAILKSKGVGYNQIRVVSYGAERLASPGHSEDAYQLDRRAVIVYTQK